MRQEVCEVLHRLVQDPHTRQVDNAEVIRLLPVEAAARDQDVLLVQEVEGKLLVVGDVELLDVELG